MSKTFKSVKSTLELTVVRTNEDLVRIITQLPGETGRAIDLAPTDIPALMLALAEAAGFEAFGADYLNKAVDCLQQHTREREREAAEAKEQAELEAEALELFKTLMGVKGYENFTWSEVASKDEWLAVARKAREIGAEK